MRWPLANKNHVLAFQPWLALWGLKKKSQRSTGNATFVIGYILAAHFSLCKGWEIPWVTLTWPEVSQEQALWLTGKTCSGHGEGVASLTSLSLSAFCTASICFSCPVSIESKDRLPLTHTHTHTRYTNFALTWPQLCPVSVWSCKEFCANCVIESSPNGQTNLGLGDTSDFLIDLRTTNTKSSKS